MKAFKTLYNEPRVYAYSLPDVPRLAGWLKVGYTDRQTVQERIAQQLKTPLLNYTIEVDERHLHVERPFEPRDVLPVCIPRAESVDNEEH